MLEALNKSLSAAQDAHKARKVIVKRIAEQAIERCAALNLKGKRRDDAVLDFFCGAASAAQALGNEPLYQHLGRIAAMVISVRGYIGVSEIARKSIDEAVD